MGTTIAKKVSILHDSKTVGTYQSTITDHAGEKLISNDTSFIELIHILRCSPRARAAFKIEAELMDFRQTTQVDSTYGRADEASTEKIAKRPSPAALRKSESMIARIEFNIGGFCEVFNNGYAIYDNGNRKCVVRVPGCRTSTYHFGPLTDKEKEYLDQKKELTEDVLGPLPWYNALILAGEDQIEYNMAHPKTRSNASDTEDLADWEEKENYRWSCGACFDNPEEAYLKKEAEIERRTVLTAKQLKVYDLYYNKCYTEEEISRILGISRVAVKDRLDCARKKFKKNPEKFFYDTTKTPFQRPNK